MGPLSERYRVIAPDLRGLGDSTRAGDGYDAENLAVDAAQLLAALEVDSAAVVGIDAGAAPAFLLALHRPDLVRRLQDPAEEVGQGPGSVAELDRGVDSGAGHARCQPCPARVHGSAPESTPLSNSSTEPGP